MKKRFSIIFFSLLFCLIFSSMAFADVTTATLPSSMYPLPDVPSSSSYVEKVLTLNNKGNYILDYFYSNGDYDLDLVVNPTTGYMTVSVSNNDYAVYNVYYAYIDGGWVQRQTSQMYADTPSHPTINVLFESTVDVYDESGNVFFSPIPLHQKIMAVAEPALAEMGLAGTIQILVLCGVGLMALLMVCVLFGKVFNRFRS